MRGEGIGRDVKVNFAWPVVFPQDEPGYRGRRLYARKDECLRIDDRNVRTAEPVQDNSRTNRPNRLSIHSASSVTVVVALARQGLGLRDKHQAQPGRHSAIRGRGDRNLKPVLLDASRERMVSHDGGLPIQPTRVRALGRMLLAFTFRKSAWRTLYERAPSTARTARVISVAAGSLSMASNDVWGERRATSAANRPLPQPGSTTRSG